MRPRCRDDEAVSVVETPDGTIRAREVALDVPAPEQARLLAADAPDHADVLRAVPIVAETILTLAIGAGAPAADRGLRARRGRARRMRSALFLSHLAPGRYATEGLVEVRYEAPRSRASRPRR